MALRLTVSCTIALLAAACGGETPQDAESALGDPIGVTIAARDDLPAFETILRLPAGVDPEPVVSAFAGLVGRAREECAAEARKVSATTNTLGVNFVVEQGRVIVSIPKWLDDPLAVCVLRAMDRQQLAGVSGEAFTLTMEIRAVPSAGSGAGEQPR